MLSHSQLPISYWSYAISTAVHIVNRLPTPNLQNLSPSELLFHSRPDIKHLRTFGCDCFPLLKPYNNHKLQPHTTSCIFLGYPAYTKGYIFLDPITSRIYISRNVLFNETDFLSSQSLSTSPNCVFWSVIVHRPSFASIFSFCSPFSTYLTYHESYFYPSQSSNTIYAFIFL